MGPVAQADWVDAWINQHAVTQGGYFEGQKRGYFTGGGFSARWRVPNEPLVTFSAPKLRGGCGGIDLFLGGMSFVNADYLVQKFQRLIQMAPAVGFEIALKTLNKELADTMGKINATVDALNGMQMNECAFHNQVVATVERDDPSVMGSIMTAVSSEYNLGEQLKTIWYENEEANNANNGEPDTDLKESISECPSEFRAIFSGGSVIGNAAAQIGMADVADSFRGYIGDIFLRPAGNLMEKIPAVKCRANNELDPEDFIEGRAQARHPQDRNNGACYNDSNTNLRTFVRDRLVSMAAKIQTPNAALSEQERAFIDAMPGQTYRGLLTAVTQGIAEHKIAMMEGPLATQYAWQLFDDLYRQIDYALRLALQASQREGGARHRCQIDFIADVVTKLRQMRGDLHTARLGAFQVYNNRLTELIRYNTLANQERADWQRARAQLTREITR